MRRDLPRPVPVPPSVAGQGVRVWWLDPGRVPAADLAVASTWLDAAERARADALATPDLAAAYVAAHGAARLLVGAALGRPPQDVEWTREPCAACGGPHGRPVVAGGPIGFSLAHTPGAVLVAVADGPVGVDVEGTTPDAARLVRLLHPRERAEIDTRRTAAAGAGPGDPVTVCFTRCWVRTEAYLKGLGVGLTRAPDQDYVGAGPDTERVVDGWRVVDLLVPAGFTAALAVPIGPGASPGELSP